MLDIEDSLAGKRITIHYAQNKEDCKRIYKYANTRGVWAFDTESTGLNSFHPDWQLRTLQFGNGRRSFVIPARFRGVIRAIAALPIRWIGHNATHDIRSVDCFLGYETGMQIEGETYTVSMHRDPRGRQEGAVDHGLKDLCTAFIDPNAGKWEKALKAEFKKITIPIEGEVYKSGKKKGQQKVRLAHLSEGWALIDPSNPIYIAYAGADPILTYHLWKWLAPVRAEFDDLYSFDSRVDLVCDRLQRRAIRLDVDYTRRFHAALDKRAQKHSAAAAAMGCKNIYSGVQIEQALTKLGAKLTETTAKGAIKTDDKIMKHQLTVAPPRAQKLIRHILMAKRVSKRREAYADAMLREMDAEGRIHPSINSLAARTLRMSVSRPALQQLPTKEEE